MIEIITFYYHRATAASYQSSCLQISIILSLVLYKSNLFVLRPKIVIFSHFYLVSLLSTLYIMWYVIQKSYALCISRTYNMFSCLPNKLKAKVIFFQSIGLCRQRLTTQYRSVHTSTKIIYLNHSCIGVSLI